MAVALLSLASCQKQEKMIDVCIDFDDVTLAAGFDNQHAYSAEGLSFGQSYTYVEEYGYDYWSGYAISNQTDTKTAGYANQYSVASGAAASGNNFAVFYYDSMNPAVNEISFAKGEEYQFKSVALCNNTYAYLSMAQGDAYAKKFADGDWFLLRITAMDANGLSLDSVDVYLADFRNGKSEIINTWKTVNLSSLGQVNKLSLKFLSSDTGTWGINTPCYVCLDNLIYQKEESQD